MPEPAAITWAPTIETEAQFLRRIEEYIGQVRRWASDQGLVPDVERRQLARDIDAFISYQVQGWDLEAVIDEYFEGASNDAARKALGQISADLDIPLRK